MTLTNSNATYEGSWQQPNNLLMFFTRLLNLIVFCQFERSSCTFSPGTPRIEVEGFARHLSRSVGFSEKAPLGPMD